MEKDNTVKVLITFAVFFILGAVLIAVIADQTIETTQKTSVSDESYNLTALGCMQGGQVNGSTDANCNITVTYAPTGWKLEDTDCALSSVSVTNYTGTALTLDTDYTLDSTTGLIAMLNTTSTEATALGGGGVVKVDYAYCGEGYLAESWGRSVLNVNVGLFAIVLLLGGAAVVYLLFGNKKDDD